MAPPDTAQAAEHAYVVEYRALDRCFVPACELRSKDVAGWLDEVQPEGDLGTYARWGRLGDEMFVRRATLLADEQELSFILPEGTSDSEIDVHFAALKAGAWAAVMRIEELRVGEPSKILEERSWSGTTRVVGPHTAPIPEVASTYFTHVRVRLPDRRGRTLRVAFRSASPRPLVVGNPLVMKRVERAPRQAVFWIADEIMHPLMRQILKEGTDDPPTAWLPKAVAAQGIYFPLGHTPGLNTSTYVRRFFRQDYFKTEGEPILAGLGIDETPPRVVPTSVARMIEAGFLAEMFVDNMVLLPAHTRMGWDGGYQTELLGHPTSITEQFKAWIAEHPHDDSLSLLWYSNTHGADSSSPLAHKRPHPAWRKPEGLPDHQIVRGKFNWVYPDLLYDVDRLLEVRETFQKASPSANRLWYIGSDHGSSFTYAMTGRGGRLPRAGLNSGAGHGIFGSGEEAQVPFAIVYDRGRPADHPASWDAPSSEVLVWQALEEAFGIDLGLPPTSTYRVPFFGTRRDPFPVWDDQGIVSWGNTGVFRLVSGGWAYRSANRSLTAAPIWSVDPVRQRVMLGTDKAVDGIVAEELYDLARDRHELDNASARNLDRLVSMRQHATDWLAAHHDPPSHPRHKYVLVFAAPTELALTAPHAFDVIADGARMTGEPVRAVSVKGTRIEIVEGRDPVRIVEISGPAASAPLVLRCAANRLPLQALSADRPRFDLATAQWNCVLPSPPAARPKEGEVWFSAEPAPRMGEAAPSALEAGAGGQSAGHAELQAGMKRWGYVRDMEKKP